MSYRKEEFADGEIYHVYNRGVDKRIVFEDKQDFFQFLQMLDLCNIDMTCGGVSAYKLKVNMERRCNKKKLVEIIAYCLNANHYHLILRQVAEDGISRFMQKVGTGYAKYFNQKNGRSGALFQGRFKSKHIGTDEYLKGLSAYVNLNNVIHQDVGNTKARHQCRALLFRSSWWEYGGKKEEDTFHEICEKDIILDGFKNKREYMKFAKSYVKNIIKARKDKKLVDLEDDKELFLEYNT